jgi:hypothetical protein
VLQATEKYQNLIFHIFDEQIHNIISMKTSGLDVHKDSIFCAVYDGKSYSAVKEFSTTTGSIHSPGAYLQSEGVKQAAMESTFTYRVPIWDILWKTGFDLKSGTLHIRQIPGRKSDAKDTQRIAELLHRHILRSRSVPSPLIRELRTCTREYRILVRQRTKVLTQVERMFDRQYEFASSPETERLQTTVCLV